MAFAGAPTSRTFALALLCTWSGLATSGCGGCGLVAPPSAEDAGMVDGPAPNPTPADGAADSGAPDATLASEGGEDAGVLDAAGDGDATATPFDGGNRGDAAHAGDALDAGEAGPPSGVLDPTFAGTGYVTRSGTAQPGTTPPDDVGTGVAVDSLGRVVVGGVSQGVVTYRAVVWRLDSAGAFDAAFGASGAWVSPAPPQNTDTLGYGVAVDGAGRPLLVGSYWPSYPGAPAMTAWRLTTDGVLDTSFNGTGQALAITNAGASYGAAVRLDDAGIPTVVGPGAVGSNMNGSFAKVMAWRLTASGAPDPSFGSDAGLGLSAGAVGSGDDRALAVAVDPSGNVVVGGFIHYGVGAFSAALWRFTSSGAVDMSFGGTGYVTFPNLSGTSFEEVYGVAMDAQNGIVFCGTTMQNLPEPRGFVARVTSSGAPDTSFGQGGIILFEPPAVPSAASSARALTIDSEGRIVVAGSITAETAQGAAVWRLTSTGAPDTTFGTLGTALVSVPGYLHAYSYSVAVDQTDRAVVTGSVAQLGSSYHDLLVFRLTP